MYFYTKSAEVKKTCFVFCFLNYLLILSDYFGHASDSKPLSGINKMFRLVEGFIEYQNMQSKYAVSLYSVRVKINIKILNIIYIYNIRPFLSRPRVKFPSLVNMKYTVEGFLVCITINSVFFQTCVNTKKNF